MIKVFLNPSFFAEKLKLLNKLIDFKGIVSRDFRCLQMILKDMAWVLGIPLDVNFFLNHVFILDIKFKVLSGLSFYSIKCT